MRYKAGYKEQKRQELLNISGQLAKKNGFANTGVDSFMKAAQMTSGAFYSHFSSKQKLFKALIEAELHKSLLGWQENPHEDLAEWIDFELERYLAISHVQRADHGCILPALSCEVARSDDAIKQLYQSELLRGHALFVKHLGREDLAWAVMCQLVGAIVIARTVADDTLKVMILNSSKWMIRQSLGLNDLNIPH